MIFIPLGIDCTLAWALRKCGLRHRAYPFDWIVTYRGVSEYLANDFQTFGVENPDLLFLHDTFPGDETKYHRRIARLRQLLDSFQEEEKEICFLRKSHSVHNHTEHARMKEDIEDMREWELLLLNRYPFLNFKIIVFQTCCRCHRAEPADRRVGSRIEIVNVSSVCGETFPGSSAETAIFESIFREMFCAGDI
jgi:hypothetical protein